MKKITLCIILIGLMFTACITGGAKVTEPIEYAEIVDVKNVSQNTLYTKANMWFVDAFRNADSVIQFSDKESGIIKGKYLDPNVANELGFVIRVYSTITVETKNGRYRISFTDPSAQYVRPNGLPGDYINSISSGLADKIRANWLQLAESLKTSITKDVNSW